MLHIQQKCLFSLLTLNIFHKRNLKGGKTDRSGPFRRGLGDKATQSGDSAAVNEMRAQRRWQVFPLPGKGGLCLPPGSSSKRTFETQASTEVPWDPSSLFQTR